VEKKKEKKGTGRNKVSLGFCWRGWCFVGGDGDLLGLGMVFLVGVGGLLEGMVICWRGWCVFRWGLVDSWRGWCF
jgi:hypothetical protein